jgi:phosphatidylinositol-3-phosphatase
MPELLNQTDIVAHDKYYGIKIEKRNRSKLNPWLFLNLVFRTTNITMVMALAFLFIAPVTSAMAGLSTSTSTVSEKQPIRHFRTINSYQGSHETSTQRSIQPAGLLASSTIQHVFVVVMENHSYSQIWNSSSAPYITSLGSTFARATNYHALTHPSLPNYLDIFGGSNYGITSDCNPSSSCHINAVNLADNLEARGLTWKGYMESMPSPCYLTTSVNYAPKHNPFIYFDDIRNNPARCISHDVPYTALASDLASAATTPNYALITPNLCNDMHACSISTGDTWLKNNLPTLLNSQACTVDKCLLILTWDEDNGRQGNQVLTIFAGSGAETGGLTSATFYTHFSLLRTVENIFGLHTQTSNDAAASPIAFGPPPTTLSSPSGNITTNYNPTYTWNEVPSSTWYLLQVNTNTPNSDVIYQWYTSAQANCNGTTCSVTPATTLAGGGYTWWVLTNNSGGDGTWSTGMNFSTTIQPPPTTATLVSPSGDIATNYNPTYTWNQVSEATWYYLWVDGPNGNVIKQWYTTVQANCNGTTCSVTPATTLSGGAYTWKVQTWNSNGYGAWSTVMNFSTTIPTLPPAATLVSPTGNIGAIPNPAYTWNEVTGSTWYLFQVNDPNGQVIYQWFTSNQAACNGTTCSVTPSTTLANGAYIWWVMTYNSAGDGPWSAGMNFTVGP